MPLAGLEAWLLEHTFRFPLDFSGCDVNSPRQPGANGEGEEEARDGQTPLHLAASWGLEETVQCLLEFGANVNTQVRRVSLSRREMVINQVCLCFGVTGAWGDGSCSFLLWAWPL